MAVIMFVVLITTITLNKPLLWAIFFLTSTDGTLKFGVNVVTVPRDGICETEKKS
jgi:hypothetical protein